MSIIVNSVKVISTQGGIMDRNNLAWIKQFNFIHPVFCVDRKVDEVD